MAADFLLYCAGETPTVDTLARETNLINVIDRFCIAVSLLPNLKAIEQTQRCILGDIRTLRWRRLGFSALSRDDYQACSKDDHLEALQLSIVLWALGHLGRKFQSIKNLSLSVKGRGLIDLNGLQRLSTGPTHTAMRVPLELRPEAMLYDEPPRSNVELSKYFNLHSQQLSALSRVFVGLSELQYTIFDNGDLQGSGKSAASFVFDMLSMAISLRRLRLVFGRLLDGSLLPFRQSPNRQCASGSIWLLYQLTRQSPWNMLTDIELEIVTTRVTLVNFLRTQRKTLRSLALCRVSLARLGDVSNEWEQTLTELGQELSLRSLFVAKLRDYAEAWEPRGPARVLFDPDADIWRNKRHAYNIYCDTVVGWVLRGKEVRCLDPALFEWAKRASFARP